MVGNDLDLWIPRGADIEADEVPDYGQPDYFTIKVFHGSCIRDNKYVGGNVNFFDYVDKDKMSLVEIDNMVRQLDPTYEGQRIDYWYRIGSEDEALTKLSTDLDAITMCCCVPSIRLVLLYLDHIELHGVYGDSLDEVYEIEDIFFSQAKSGGVVIEELPDSPRKIAKRNAGIVIREVQDIVPFQQMKAASIGPNDKGKEKVDERSNQNSSGIDFDDLHDIDILDFMQSYGGQGFEDNEEDEEDDGSDGNNDDDYNPEVDDEDYDPYGIDDDDDDDDDDVEGMEGSQGADGGKQTEDGVGTSSQGSVLGSIDAYADLEDNEDMFANVDSDEERMGPAVNSDGEPEDEFPEFNPNTDMKKPEFCKGMIFANVRILRAALREKAIQGGWEYVYLKNDKQRLRVICKEDDCPFELYASKMQHENTLMIKTYESEHKCTRKWNNTMVRSRYLTAKFKDKIQLNENWNTGSLAQTMSTKIKARVSKQMAYRAKRAALLELEGSIREQFARLADYGKELQRVDPATTIDIKL
ncbi:kinesin-related protein 4-like [Rosa chinensis]|uniref:kinesin-related protein 4-like n=1 Tax=Rosa chinensis TaxID=74649 RepID=UPI000D088750|nr:kinesin-related protein 4-like [Rosa chinensis]